MCAGRPRLEPDSSWAGEEAGLWGVVEDHRLGLHCSSAGTYGAHQSQVTIALANSNKLAVVWCDENLQCCRYTVRNYCGVQQWFSLHKSKMVDFKQRV